MRIPIIFLFAICVPLIGLGSTIKVPMDFPTIQQAINGAQSGDTVLVAAGTYVENISFLGKHIHLKSEQGPQKTIIDGGQNHSTVEFVNGEIPLTRLEGFTITNGSGQIGGYWQNIVGGGIFADQASPTIINNIIENNIAADPAGIIDGSGGGIYVVQSHGILSNNIIRNNSSSNSGGGVYLERSSTLVTDNLICGNQSIFTGGGLKLNWSSHAEVSNNTISQNHSGEGGGVFVSYWCDAVIKNNLISNNTANFGGGIEITENTKLLITDNSITDNFTSSGGGGVSILNDSSLIAGNRIFNNVTNYYGGGILEDKRSGGYSLRVENNLIYENTSKFGKGGGAYMVADPNTDESYYRNNLIFKNSVTNGGGGVALRLSSKINITNCLIWDNQSNNYGSGVNLEQNSEAHISNSIIRYNRKSTAVKGQIALYNKSKATIGYSNLEGGQPKIILANNSVLNWGAGMIDGDPLFVDPGHHDFHIQYHSPCRNAGDPLISNPPGHDFEGDPRIAEMAPDMGPDEFYPHLYHKGDPTPNGTVHLRFIGIPGSAPNGLFIGSGILENPYPSAWGSWFLKFPILPPIPLGSIPSPSGVLTLSGVIPGSAALPYEVPMQALIANELTNPSVLTIH